MLAYKGMLFLRLSFCLPGASEDVATWYARADCVEVHNRPIGPLVMPKQCKNT